MNQLSWLIYWADAAPSISMFVSIIAFLGFVASLVGTGLFIASRGAYRKAVAVDLAIEAWKTLPEADRGVMPGTHYCEEVTITAGEREFAAFSPTFRVFPYLLVVFFFLWGGSFLVPSKDTFYLIAASEAGEKAIKTPEFTKVRAVLNKWLDEQSGTTTEEKK